jgi:signal transduction histidine kinase
MAKILNKDSHLLRWAASGGAAVLLLLFGALIFSNSRSTSDTLDEAGALHTADMTLAVQDVAMKSIGQLVLLAQDLELGVASQEAVDAAVAEAQRALVEFQTRSSKFDAATVELLGPAITTWEEAAAAVVTAATEGEALDATDLLVNTLVPAAESLAADLTTERDRRASTVDDAQRRAGRMAQIAGFLTAFLLPLGAMVVYRSSLRRQLEVSQAHLDARLAAERSVGRAKDQFIANISHELRTPLTSIYGFSEVLLDQGLVDPQLAGDLVGLINSESAELARMVEDLLVAAHDDDAPLAVETSPVAIADELDAVLLPFRRRDIEIGGTYASADVVGDQLRIRQILRNLLSNAVQHGGPTIRVFGDIAGSHYVIAVEDDGPGVPEQIVPRLFTRFVHQGETPLTAGSVGLGLAVAHLLAEAMNGSLDYERLPDRSSFILTLPLVEMTEEVARSADLLAPAAK